MTDSERIESLENRIAALEALHAGMLPAANSRKLGPRPVDADSGTKVDAVIANIVNRLVPSSLAPVEGKLTTDPTDPRLGHGGDDKPGPQNEAYLVLSVEERAKGFVRPFRDTYAHEVARGGCGAVTHMGRALSETYARDPKFYGATYCVGCQMHRPVREFCWTHDGETVGS